MYKIRNKLTGLYSNGGAYPRWTKRGKTWNALHHVRAHLRSNSAYKQRFYADAELLKYDISIDNVSTVEGIL